MLWGHSSHPHLWQRGPGSLPQVSHSPTGLHILANESVLVGYHTES